MPEETAERPTAGEAGVAVTPASAAERDAAGAATSPPDSGAATTWAPRAAGNFELEGAPRAAKGMRLSPVLLPPASSRPKAGRNAPPTARPPTPRLRAGKFGPRQFAAWLGAALFAGCGLGLLLDAPRPGERPEISVGGDNRQLPPVVVVLDAGHGGADTGAVALGMVEKDLTLDMVQRIAARLTRRGVTTRLTRDTDRYVPLAARARFANSLPSAVFISVHFNHAANAPASGIETFYTAREESPLAFKSAVENGLAAAVWRWLLGLGGAAGPENSQPRMAVGADRDQGGGGGAAHENGVLPQLPDSESHALAARIQGALVARTAAADRGVKERSLYVTRNVRGPAVLVEGGFVSNPAEARLLGDPAYRQRLADSIGDGIVEYLTEAAQRNRKSPASPKLAAAAAAAAPGWRIE